MLNQTVGDVQSHTYLTSPPPSPHPHTPTLSLSLSHTHTLFFPQGVVITEALGKVPLLEGLTEAQLARISDCVEMLPFSMGKLHRYTGAHTDTDTMHMHAYTYAHPIMNIDTHMYIYVH